MRSPATTRLGIKALLFPNWSAAIITAMLIALSGAIGGVAHAEDANISNRRNAERTSFTNDEIKDGFFKIAFGAELQLGRRLARIRKFDEPVRVFVFDQADPKRRVGIAAGHYDTPCPVGPPPTAIKHRPPGGHLGAALP